METLSFIFWGLALLVALFSRMSVKVNGKPVRNPIARAITMIFALAFVGLFFWLLGFVGEFILLAPKALF